MISIENPWLGHVTPDIKFFKSLPLIYNGPVQYLFILPQTHSSSLSYWNLKSVYTKYIPIFSHWVAPVLPIYLVLQDSCTRCIPTVMWDDLGGVGMQIVLTVTLSVFQLYLELLTHFWHVSSVNWNVSSIIWNASSVNPIHIRVKRGIGMCLV
jgi:hypothetical protein